MLVDGQRLDRIEAYGKHLFYRWSNAMVGMYRTHAALEAAWKYFILCGVGIAQALVHTGGNRTAAARLLGISRAKLYERLQGLSELKTSV